MSERDVRKVRRSNVVRKMKPCYIELISFCRTNVNVKRASVQHRDGRIEEREIKQVKKRLAGKIFVFISAIFVRLNE